MTDTSNPVSSGSYPKLLGNYPKNMPDSLKQRISEWRDAVIATADFAHDFVSLHQTGGQNSPFAAWRFEIETLAAKKPGTEGRTNGNGVYDSGITTCGYYDSRQPSEPVYADAGISVALLVSRMSTDGKENALWKKLIMAMTQDKPLREGIHRLNSNVNIHLATLQQLGYECYQLGNEAATALSVDALHVLDHLAWEIRHIPKNYGGSLATDLGTRRDSMIRFLTQQQAIRPDFIHTDTLSSHIGKQEWAKLIERRRPKMTAPRL